MNTLVPLNDGIAVLMFNNATNNRNTVLHYRDDDFQHISELHKSYDPLQYPLLFPNVTAKWQKIKSWYNIIPLVRQMTHVLLLGNTVSSYSSST